MLCKKGLLKFLQTLKDQIEAGAGGNATGRNIHQKSLKEAIKMCNAIYKITIEGKSNLDIDWRFRISFVTETTPDILW